VRWVRGAGRNCYHELDPSVVPGQAGDAPPLPGVPPAGSWPPAAVAGCVLVDYVAGHIPEEITTQILSNGPRMARMAHAVSNRYE
jgi:hypothetical protein